MIRWLLIFLLIAGSVFADSFGNETDVGTRQVSSDTKMLGYYQYTGASGYLDSICFWAKYENTGPDTVTGVIYGPNTSRTFLGRSSDSTLVTLNGADPTRYTVHFTPGTIAITQNTYYWAGVHNRGEGGSTIRFGQGSATDSGAVVADVLPFDDPLGTSSHGLGSVYDAPRISVYVTPSGGGGGGSTTVAGVGAGVGAGVASGTNGTLGASK